MINHITHLEDLAIFNGEFGISQIQNYLWNIQNGHAHLTTKYDGAPSIFAGVDFMGPWVSPKHKYLSKRRTMYYSAEDMDDIPIGLKYKLIECLKYLPDIIPQGVTLQGDLLFTEDSLMINNDSVSFMPNVIKYTFPPEKFKDWKLGVVWHTWITNGEEYYPQFGNLLSSKDVLSIDPYLKNYDIPDDIFYIVSDYIDDIDMDWLNELSSNQLAASALASSYNTFLKDSTLYFYNPLVAANIVDEFLTKKIGTYKTPLNITKWKEQKRQILNLLNYSKLAPLLRYMDMVRVAKRIIINRLEIKSKFNTHVLNGDRVIDTTNEGYVLIDQSTHIKIVNRDVFSKINFSSKYMRGWGNKSYG